MGVELILGFAVGLVTPSVARKAKTKIKPWLRGKLRSLLEIRNT